ncbi:hypothetical protein [Actinokineospora sp. NPDC004072]
MRRLLRFVGRLVWAAIAVALDLDRPKPRPESRPRPARQVAAERRRD